jgi:hypothetical protein
MWGWTAGGQAQQEPGKERGDHQPAGALDSAFPKQKMQQVTFGRMMFAGPKDSAAGKDQAGGHEQGGQDNHKQRDIGRIGRHDPPPQRRAAEDDSASHPGSFAGILFCRV